MNQVILKQFKDPILESDVELYLCKIVKKYGGTCEKFKSPARRSVPDRLITFPGGHMFFVECKAPGKDATHLQKKDHKKRRDMGCEVFVIDTKAKAKLLIETRARKYGITI